MSSKSSSNIASKAYSKAEADFSTWLMMAKLGSFDDLPSNAQNFLTSYRDRLETMSEAESTVLAVREVYSAYYSEMGGVGAAPEPQTRKPIKKNRSPKHQPARSAAPRSIRPMIRKSLPALLVFASLVALVVTYILLTQ
jgi:hypothetical protein